MSNISKWIEKPAPSAPSENETYHQLHEDPNFRWAIGKPTTVDVVSYCIPYLLVAMTLGLLLIALLKIIKKWRRDKKEIPYNIKCLISIISTWFLLILGWGFIFDWSNYFDSGFQYFGLIFLPPVIGIWCYTMLRWLNKTRV